MPSTTLPATYMSEVRANPPVHNESASNENVEKVVYPPRIPVARK
jgi:hypothetical protein